jgi:tRNA A-37 threonylcarbamoyl transferase component Bud32
MAPTDRSDVPHPHPDQAAREPLGARYRLERALGSGASATVWIAFDTVLERRVAVKILAEGLAGEPDRLERFRREARALAKLGHPHIVTVIDVGEEAGTPFIVLEYIAGETLKERLRRVGRLPVDEAIAYTIEVARALAAAHERGIVHRDVKAQNILLDPDGGAKLTDFGIARSGAEVALTQGGRVLGTTDYVSPEQALGHEVGGPSDLYSLGIVLYEALTGGVPFTGSSQLAVATMHVRAQMPDVQRSRPEVSATLAAVIDHATAKRPDRRYPDAHTMIGELERALAIETARAGDATGAAHAVLRTLPAGDRSRVPLRVRHPHSIGLTAAVVALVLAAVAAFALANIHGNANRHAPLRSVEARESLDGATAAAYNPFGRGGPDNAAQAQVAIAGRPGSGWVTNRYAHGALGKPGVGVYIALPRPLAANRLSLTTSTPGFALQVWGANRLVSARSASVVGLVALGWRQLGQLHRVGDAARVALHQPASPYRYYLAWITQLQPDSAGAPISAQISDLGLWRAVRR